MARRVASVMVGCLLAGAVAFVVPWFVRDRPMPGAVPSPAALFSLASVRVPGGAEVCFGDAAIEQHSQEALFVVKTGRPQGPPLELTARAAGWSQDVRVPGGYG